MTQTKLGQRKSLTACISSLAEEAAAALGFEIVHVEIRGGNRPIVRIFIDRPAGVGLEDCERFSKRFSVLLDVEDWIQFSYILEVSSPGLDRPLVKEADFKRFTGKQATVRTKGLLAGQKNFKGTILGIRQGKLALELAHEKRVEIALREIEKANLVADI